MSAIQSMKRLEAEVEKERRILTNPNSTRSEKMAAKNFLEYAEPMLSRMKSNMNNTY